MGPVYDVVIDQCAMHVVCPKTKMPVLKPTRLVTTSMQFAQTLLPHRCPKHHTHARLEGTYKGKNLTKYAEEYPTPMSRILVKCLLRSQPSPVQWPVLAIEHEPEAGALTEPADSEGDSEAEAPEQASNSEGEDGDTREKRRRQALIRRLHVNTGHASVETDAPSRQPMSGQPAVEERNPEIQVCSL